MALISFMNVSKYYQSDLILDHISFSINQKERVALIGDNGAGKTTIFKLILNEEEPTLLPKEDKPGEIMILGNLKIGYLNQNAISDINHTVNDELLLCFKRVFEIENKIKAITDKINKNPAETQLFNEYDRLMKEFDDNHGYTYLNEIEELITRFGFSKDYLTREIASLSGGERMKIAFIKILLFRYDVLLLDEPTNHLDISTIEWLEDFLKKYKGTIFFISHDRYFLESLSTKIIELDNHQIYTYNMDYNHYLLEKEANYKTLLKEAKTQQKEIERLKRFIEYYKPKPRFTSRAKDKEKKLERIEKNKIEVPNQRDKRIKFQIEGSNLKNKKLLSIKDLTIGYDIPLCPPFNFEVYGKDKLAICGDNGIGKTTLIKTITSQIPAIFGEIKEMRKIRYGYIKQNDYVFDKGENAIEFLKNKYPQLLEREIRDVLGRFMFKGEDAFKDTSLMSNGEKMRLILCAFSMSNYDILLLDEPTNHLDMVTKESLIEALKNYDGCIIFISHDRYFINQLATHVLYLSFENVVYLEGDYNLLRKTLDNIKKDNELKKIEDIENPKIEKPKKLSNNAINKYKEELCSIENRIMEIDLLLEEDFESYEKIDKLNDEKEELEFKYVDILEILEKDKNL